MAWPSDQQKVNERGLRRVVGRSGELGGASEPWSTLLPRLCQLRLAESAELLKTSSLTSPLPGGTDSSREITGEAAAGRSQEKQQQRDHRRSSSREITGEAAAGRSQEKQQKGDITGEAAAAGLKPGSTTLLTVPSVTDTLLFMYFYSR